MTEQIAYAGDWHGNTDWAIKMLCRLDDRGVRDIVHAGDFGLWPRGAAFLDKVESALAAFGQTLYWVDGNHDDHSQLAEWPIEDDGTHLIRPHIHHMPRGHRWSVNGTTHLALGGAVSIDRHYRVPGLEWWPQEVITNEDVNLAIEGGTVDVMVCHDAPTEVPKLDEFLASNGFRLTPEIEADAYHSRRQVRRVVTAVRPKTIIHGHYHYRYVDRAHGAFVHGLDCDGSSLGENIVIMPSGD